MNGTTASSGGVPHDRDPCHTSNARAWVYGARPSVGAKNDMGSTSIWLYGDCLLLTHGCMHRDTQRSGVTQVPPLVFDAAAQTQEVEDCDSSWVTRVLGLRREIGHLLLIKPNIVSDVLCYHHHC